MSDPTRTLHATIGGMHCINCAGEVEKRLRAVPHVEGARVHYPFGRAVIAHGEELDVAASRQRSHPRDIRSLRAPTRPRCRAATPSRTLPRSAP